MSHGKYGASNCYILNKTEEMVCDKTNCNVVIRVVTFLTLASDYLAVLQVRVTSCTEVSMRYSCQLLNGTQTDNPHFVWMAHNVRKAVKKKEDRTQMLRQDCLSER